MTVVVPINMASEKEELAHVMAELEDRRRESPLEFLELMPMQQSFVDSTANTVLAFGGNRCLGGECEIYDPYHRKMRRVDSINEDSFWVEAWNGKKRVNARALRPFKKENDDLYEIGLSNGQSFTASLNHLVLTPLGYLSIFDCLLKCAGVLQQSNLESYQLTHALGGQNSSEIIEDFQDDYHHEYHSHDERLRMVKGIDPTFVPLQNDVQKYTSSVTYERKDDFLHTRKHSHFYLLSSHPSNLGVLAHFLGRYVGILCHAFYILYKLILHLRLNNYQSKLASFLRRSIVLFFQRGIELRSNKAYSITSYLAIISIHYNRHDVKWDFTVPGYHNYILAGAIHHNSGKTTPDAKIVIDTALKKRSKIWVCGETFQDSIAIQQKKISELVPRSQVRYGSYDDINGYTNRKLQFKNGSLVFFKCHARGQRVLMSDGVVKDIFNIDIGEFVRCSDGSSRRVNKVFKYPPTKVFNIETKGHTLRVTPNHKLFVIGRGWVLADDIKKDDVLECISYGGTREDVALWKPYVLALMITEGCMRGKSPDFTTNIPDVLKAIEGVLPDDIFIKKISQKYMPYGYRLSSKTQYSNRIKKYLEDIGLWNKLSYDKFIPPEVFTWSSENRKYFLEMMFACDGTVKRMDARYTTSSERLARDMQTLLWTFNIHPDFRKVNDKHYYLGISGENRKRFDIFKVIGKPIKYNPHHRWNIVPEGKVISKYSNDRYVEVCCLEIDGAHEMIVEGIRSHNSYDQGREAFQSDDIDLIVNDEEPPLDIIKEQKMRLIDRNGRMIISMTSLKGITDFIRDYFEDCDILETRWAPLVKKEIPVKARKGSVDIFFLWTTDNKHIDQKRLMEEVVLMPETDRLTRIYGMPTNLAGKIYMSFGRDTHVISLDDAPTSGNQLWNVIDPHDRKPWAMGWYLVNKNETVYCVDEYPDNNFNEMLYDDKTYEDYARIIKQKEDVLRKVFNCGGLIRRRCDPNFGNKTVQFAERKGGQSKTTPIKELARLGLYYKDGIDALEAGHLEVRKWLHWVKKEGRFVVAPKFVLTDNCKNHINHLTRYSRKDIIGSDGDVKDKVSPQQKYKDFSDLVRYLLMANPKWIADVKWNPPHEKLY